MNNQTLEMQIKSNSESAIQSLNKLISQINDTGNSVKKVSAKIDKDGNATIKNLTTIEKQGNKVYKTFQKIDKNGSLNTVSTSVTTLKDKIDKTSNSANKLSKALSLGTIAYATKKISTMAYEWIGNAIDYTEQLNLFNVVFKNIEEQGKKTYSELGKQAIQYQNKLNEAFGTNKKQTLYFEAIFQSMGENSDIKDMYSAIMSETMTNLTYDLASLYNKRESDVAEALRAGVYSGQTKPLRSYGIDVTQNTMTPILESLGITDRTVKELSYAEKEILRYIATLEQAQVAMGDMANTIESPSNQLKVLRQQAEEAKIAVSSLFIGTFGNVLPYLNAFLMVVKEVSQAIATMFGIELTDYNSGIASSEDAYDSLADSIDDATNSVKELKRQTLGFDQIHNINENKNKNSGLTASGIDQRLLDAIKSYDNGLDRVKMKATTIRDRIMEWLGFTKEIDSETGEVNFKFANTDSTLYKVVTALKEIYDNGKIIITEVFKKIKDDFDNGFFGQTLATCLKAIGDGLKLISQNKTAVNIIATIVESLLIIKGLSFLGTITGISKIAGSLSSVSGATATALGAAGTGSLAVGATGLLGMLGILTILTETLWIVNLTTQGFKETKTAIETTSNTTEQLSLNAKEARKKLVDMAMAGDTSSESFRILADYLIRNIERGKSEIEVLEELKQETGILTSVKKAYSTQQDLLNQSNKNTLDIMKKLCEQGYITEELYYEFANAVGELNHQALNLNPNLRENKDNTLNFAEECKKAKEETDKLKDSVVKFDDKLGLLSDKSKNNNLEKLTDDMNHLEIQTNASKNKVLELQNVINGTNSKSLTIDVSANTMKFRDQLANAITSAWGMASGGGFRSKGGVYSNGAWHDIPQYANGGSPSHGTAFVAGEYGAEVVGHINGKTEVLNQSQLASVMYSAVVNGMSQVMSQMGSQASQIDLHLHTDEGIVVDRINQQTRQTGICPIDIPVFY